MGKTVLTTKMLLAGIAAMLLVFVPTIYAHAENKVTQVRYEVSATVVYIDGEVQTTQKVPTGTTLKKPQPADASDFLGWRDAETGCFWNFDEPVEKNLTLVAVYASAEGQGAISSVNSHSEDAQLGEQTAARSKLQADRAQALTATADPLVAVLYVLASVAAVCVLVALIVFRAYLHKAKTSR